MKIKKQLPPPPPSSSDLTLAFELCIHGQRVVVATGEQEKEKLYDLGLRDGDRISVSIRPADSGKE